MATHGRFFELSRRHIDDYIIERLDDLLAEADPTPADDPAVGGVSAAMLAAAAG